MKRLRIDQQLTTADEFQKVINLCQNIRKNLHDKQSRTRQLKEEIDAYTERLAAAMKTIQINEDVIQQQQKQIGMKIMFAFRLCDCEYFVYVFFYYYLESKKCKQKIIVIFLCDKIPLGISHIRVVSPLTTATMINGD